MPETCTCGRHMRRPGGSIEDGMCDGACRGVERLRRAFEAYRAAEFGQLNTTAESLREAARRAGYPGEHAGEGVIAWTKRTLGIGDRS